MSPSLVVKLLLLAALISSGLMQVHCLEFDFPEFHKANESKLIMSSNSYIVLGAIQVTPDVNGGSMKELSGRAVYGKQFRLWSKSKGSASFNTTFVLNIKNQTFPGGEGLAFIITEDPELPENSQGKWLGIVNENTNGSSATKTVAVEFDTRKSFPEDIDGNHVGFDIGSIYSRKQVSLTGRGIELSASIDVVVHVRYDGKNLSVFASPGPNPESDMQNLLFSEPLEVSRYLPEKVYVGFSASTSNYTQLNCVRSWKFSGLDVDKERNLLWVRITVPVVAVALLCVVVIFCLYWKKKIEREKEEDPYPSIEAQIKGSNLAPRKFRLRELKKATGNFSPRNKLGKGGFGTVYKGIWRNKEVAVKRVSKKSHQGKQEFVAEVTTIGNLNHRNLVKLIGWCYESRELLLVYEYMPNGSLDKFIFCDENSGMEESTLIWDTRVSIIHGVAQALDYLHHGCDKRVLHRDIKASNIMLDSEFNARLGDFGLARTIQQSEKTHHSTKEIAGTPGYMAPEIFLTGRATVETDVYAFGILILEVVCGRKPGNQSEQNNYNNSIVYCLWELYGKGLILDAVDPRLDGEFSEKEMEGMLILGLACCHPNPHQRPSMKTVLQVLTGEADPPQVPLDRPSFVWPAMPPSFRELDHSLTGSQLTPFSDITGR